MELGLNCSGLPHSPGKRLRSCSSMRSSLEKSQFSTTNFQSRMSACLSGLKESTSSSVLKNCSPCRKLSVWLSPQRTEWLATSSPVGRRLGASVSGMLSRSSG